MYFGYICERAGIQHHVDTSIIIPHAQVGFIDQNVSKTYRDNHKELGTIEEVKGFAIK